MNFKKNGKVFTSKSVGTGPSSFEKKKKNYRAAVSQRLRNTAAYHYKLPKHVPETSRYDISKRFKALEPIKPG